MPKGKKAVGAVRLRAGWAASLAALAAALPRMALAQTEASAAPSADVSADGRGLGSSAATGGIQDIVVTARKRSENLRDVPVAITALSGAALQTSNVARITDLVTLVPNFTLSNGALLPLTFIRGFGSSSNLSFEQAVGKFVDNVSFGRDFDARIPLFDLDRVEVLRGPQVLLYGNSATAGALNITTKKPGDHFEADISSSYEFVANEAMVQGGVTAPIADWASLRVGGTYQDLSRGWVYNVGNGKHEPTIRNWAVRPILLLKPTAGLQIMLKAEIDRLRDRGSTAQQSRQSTIPTRQVPDPVLDGRRNTNYDVAPFFQKEFAIAHNELYQGDVTYDLGSATLSSTTAYRRAHYGSAIGNAAAPSTLAVSADERYKQFSQEVRLSGKAGALDYLVGGYYQADTLNYFGTQALDVAPYGLPVPRFGRLFLWDQHAKSYSGFGDLTYHLTEKLSLEAGARYSIIHKSADQTSDAISLLPSVTFHTLPSAAILNAALRPLVTGVLGGIPHAFFNIKTREKHFQPQIVAQYRFAPRNQLFVKFVKGDKAGGTDSNYSGSVLRGANTTDLQFAPERARSSEAGIKGITAGSRLEYSVTGYSTTFSNLQAGILVGAVPLTTNVGKARSRGVELELTYIPVEGLRINGGAAYQRARYLSYPNAGCTVAQTQAVPPCVPPATQDLSGAPLPFAPEFSGSMGVTYQTDVGDFRLVGGASTNYRSRYNTSLNNDRLGDQKGVATIDAHIDLSPARGWWTVQLFGRNLSDRNYKEYSVAAPLVTGAFNVFTARGRQVGIRLSAKLD